MMRKDALTPQEKLDLWASEVDSRIAARASRGMGRITVITGPQHSGKTSYLDSIALHARMAGEFAMNRKDYGMPLDIRYYMHDHSPERIHKDLDRATRSKLAGPRVAVRRLDDPQRIRVYARAGTDLAFVDDAHLFHDQLVDICEELATQMAIDVTVAGRPLDPQGIPVESMAGILCYADDVEVRAAICTMCGAPASRFGTRGAGGESRDPHDPLVPACRGCASSRSSRAQNSHLPPAGLYVIAGPAFAGKSEEFWREIRRVVVAYAVQLFYPRRIGRRPPLPVSAYNSAEAVPILVDRLSEVLDAVRAETAAVFIDSVEAFADTGASMAREIDLLVEAGKTVVCTAREVDERGTWIPGVGHLLCYADKIRKMRATCHRCSGIDRAVRVEEMSECSTPSRFAVAPDGREFRSLCRACLRGRADPHVEDGAARIRREPSVLSNSRK
jgi:thymidine kinase